jgi:hypothetical protein
MARSVETYRRGYEKGRANNLAGHTAEAIFSMLRDDPGGHYLAGYRDGAAGKRFNPPTNPGDRNARSKESWLDLFF